MATLVKDDIWLTVGNLVMWVTAEAGAAHIQVWEDPGSDDVPLENVLLDEWVME